jgi:predicted RNA-binding Zn ribbon-like protein
MARSPKTAVPGKLAKSSWTFDLSGGQVAIDFANTVSARHTNSPIERLPDYAALLAFAQQTKLVARPEVARLERWALVEPEAAQAIVACAVELREALYRIFAGLPQARRADPRDLAALNRQVARLRLGVRLEWEWEGGQEAPDAILGVIVRHALDLLLDDARRRVRLCEADDCVWVFLDTSKNHSRRWCDMKQCGNRMKARRFYERQRAGGK